MLAIFITFISLISHQAFATRSVPHEFVAGIETYLPVKYYKLFEMTNKDSGEYTVLVHEVTQDLLQISNDSRRKGQNYLSYRFLKLANYLFPYRDDVKARYNQIASEIILSLNTATDCSPSYADLVSEIKLTFPARFKEIKNEECNSIIEQAKDLNAEVAQKLKQETLSQEEQALILAKEIERISLKVTPSEKEEMFLAQHLIQAFLGSIVIESFGPIKAGQDGKLTGQFFLFWKHSALSYDSFKEAWKKLNGAEQYAPFNVLGNTPLKLKIKFIQNDKVHETSGSLKLYSFDYLVGLLRSFNLFSIPEIKHEWISNIFDPNRFTFQGKDFKMGFDSTYKSYSMMSFELPGFYEKDLKKIIISISEK
jgi:hypothetical protein